MSNIGDISVVAVKRPVSFLDALCSQLHAKTPFTARLRGIRHLQRRAPTGIASFSRIRACSSHYDSYHSSRSIYTNDDVMSRELMMTILASLSLSRDNNAELTLVRLMTCHSHVYAKLSTFDHPWNLEMSSFSKQIYAEQTQ